MCHKMIKKLAKKTNPQWLYYTFDFPRDRAVERFTEMFGEEPKAIELTILHGGTVLRVGPIPDLSQEMP